MHLEIFSTLAAAADNNASALDSVLDTVKQIFGPFGVKPVLLVAQIINFAVVAVIVYQFGIKKVLATVDERNKKIADGLQFADDVKNKLAETEIKQAEVLKQASLEGKKVIAEARETAKALVEKAGQDATRQAEDIVKKGQTAITLERQQMLADLRREVAQLVVATSQRVLGRDLSADERTRFNSGAASDLGKN